ncbi:MAG: M24 family metallopeptidase [Pseudomonadota bacterium]
MTRLDRLRGQMAATHIDLVALAPGAHLAWLFGLKPHADERPLLACVSATGVGFLMPALEADSLRQHTDLPFFPWSDAEGPNDAFKALLAALGADTARAIALDECMRADHAALVATHLPGARREFSETTVGALRMRKEPAEVDALFKNARLADAAMEAAFAAAAPGRTEAEVAAAARARFTEGGAKPLFTIVGAGPNGAFPHHQTGATALAQGDAAVMDIGASMDGTSSDITRMAVIGHPPEGYEAVHAIVDRAVEAALIAAKPGVAAHTVDDAARTVITEAGYGEYFVHRTGHGLGTEVHEPPYITASSKTVLDEGMVFSIEPGIYLPGRFGIRLEEIVVLRADGPKILSSLPRDVRVIP